MFFTKIVTMPVYMARQKSSRSSEMMLAYEDTYFLTLKTA